MKLPQLSPFLSRFAPAPRPPTVLRLDGFGDLPRVVWWASATVAVARSRCRLRWFRLSGVPAAERLGALRLQVQAWQPFDATDARLVLSGEDGLAIAWDAAALERDLASAGVPRDRIQCLPEPLLQPAADEGVRLIRSAEGFEAQRWQGGFLRASRWWAQPLTERDWHEFVHASGAEVAWDAPVPEPVSLGWAPTAWARHHALHPSADGADARERQLVLLGGLGLSLVAGLMAHQLWDASRESAALTQQMADIKKTMQPTLAARDAALSAVAEVERLANWFAVPLPVDVLGHLHDTLSKSGVLIKDLELEGDKLRLGLQLGPNATRAGIVKDLQAGNWLVDVTEVRADNARGLLTMEMRLAGLRPPVSAAPAADGSAGQAVVPARPAGVDARSAPPTAAVAPPVPAASPARPAVSPAAAAPAATPAAPAPRPAPKGPPKPIIATPDANGMPPADVFNAIPNR